MLVEASMQIAADALLQSAAATAESHAGGQTAKEVERCRFDSSCLLTQLSNATFEHNMQTDPQARVSDRKKELALRSIPAAWLPDAEIQSKIGGILSNPFSSSYLMLNNLMQCLATQS